MTPGPGGRLLTAINVTVATLPLAVVLGLGHAEERSSWLGLLTVAFPLAVMLGPLAAPENLVRVRRTAAHACGAILGAGLLAAALAVGVGSGPLDPAPLTLARPDLFDRLQLARAAGQLAGPGLVAACLAASAALPLVVVRVVTPERSWLGLAGAVGAAVLALPWGDPFFVGWALTLGAVIGLAVAHSDRHLAPAIGKAEAEEGKRPPRALRHGNVLRHAPAGPALLGAALLSWGAGAPIEDLERALVHVPRRPGAADAALAEAALREVHAAQQAHHRLHGRYALTLGDLAAVGSATPAWADGVHGGYVLRHVSDDRGARWAVAADPGTPDGDRARLAIDAAGELQTDTLPIELPLPEERGR